MFKDLETGLTQAIDLERQISELEDVVASLQAVNEIFRNDLCQIVFEGEDNTDIGLRTTLDRIKERINYMSWLEESEGD